MNQFRSFLRPTMIAISCIVFFITLEICARIDDTIKYNAPFWGDYSDDRLRSRDSDGDTFNVPNIGFEKWSHNNLGFRGPDIPVNRLTGTTRVVCLGSSESYGLYENPGKEWPAQLQIILGSSRYQVINTSVAGLTFFNFGSYLRKHVFQLNPDIIVFVINPLFYATVIENASKPVLKSSTQNTPNGGKLLITSIPSHLRILPKVKQVIKKSVSDYSPQQLEKYQLKNLNRQVEELERLKLKGKKRKDTVPDSYVRSFRYDLVKLIKLCQSRGINVLLTTYPTLMDHNNIQEHPVIFTDHNRFCIDFNYDGSIDIVDKFNTVISSVAKKQHLMFVDTAAFLPKNTLYFADNVHYTDQGARLIAERIAENIVSFR